LRHFGGDDGANLVISLAFAYRYLRKMHVFEMSHAKTETACAWSDLEGNSYCDARDPASTDPQKVVEASIVVAAKKGKS